jgi:tRNA-Thr(GGU) m(6)t(6)A37 methyltransferase TsaA
MIPAVRSYTIRPVAYVHAGRTEVTDDCWGGTRATIELAPGVPTESLDGIEEFSHAEILFVFDRLPEEQCVAGARHPRNNMAWPRTGIFAQRAKVRPNRIGATMARILERKGRSLVVEGLDAIDGTPVVDIKPVMAEFLPRGEVRQPAWSHELMREYWAGERR